MDYVLTSYALSQQFVSRLEAAIRSRPRYLRLSDLRRMPTSALLMTLNRLKAKTLYIPFEDESCQAIIPLLLAIAFLVNTKHVEVVHPSLSRERISRGRCARLAINVLGASVTGQVDLTHCWQELRKLSLNLAASSPLGSGKRVLYLKTNMWFGLKAGGSVGHVAGVINALMQGGFAVDYVSAEPPVLLNPGFRHVRIPHLQTFGIPSEVNLYRFQRQFVENAWRILAEEKYSFVYQRLSVGNYVGPILSRRFGIPLVTEYNGSEVWVQKNWGANLRYARLAQMAEDTCLRDARLVVTVSEVLREELIGRGIPDSRIVSYPNCIDPGMFDPESTSSNLVREIRARHGLDEDSIVVAFIGTFGPWHGVEILARAIAELTRNHSDWLNSWKVRFLIVGDGAKMSEVKRILSDERSKLYSTLTGLIPQAEAPGYLAASDVLVSPHVPNSDGSRFFGSPTKLFEYMAMGKAIVASNLEQIGTILSPGLDTNDLPPASPVEGADSQMSVLVSPGDVDALIKGIRFLVERPDWRALLGRNARKEALAKYTWRHHVAAILKGLQLQSEDLEQRQLQFDTGARTAEVQ